MRRNALAVAFALLLAPPTLAHAESAELAGAEGLMALELDGHLGWSAGEQAGGVTASGAGRFRYHVLTAGLGLQAASALFVHVASVSTLAGLVVPVGWLRVHVLGELGLNAYDGIHRGFLNDDPGTGGVLPFAGGRASLLVLVRRNVRGHGAWVGITGSYAEDLSTLTKTYSWRDTGEDWFSGESYDEPRDTTVVIGQTRYALLASVCVTYTL